MATVLEGTAKLGGVNGQSKRLVGGGADVDVWVLGHGGTDSGTPGEGNMIMAVKLAGTFVTNL